MFAIIRNHEKRMSHKALMQMLDQCEKEMFPDARFQDDESASTPTALVILGNVARSVAQAFVN